MIKTKLCVNAASSLGTSQHKPAAAALPTSIVGTEPPQLVPNQPRLTLTDWLVDLDQGVQRQEVW